MKFNCLAAGFVAACLANGVAAQGYAGALIMMSNVAGGCLEGSSGCDKAGAGASVFFGTKLERPVLGFDSVEFGLLRSGAARSETTADGRVENEVGEPVDAQLPASIKLRSTAMTFSLVRSYVLTPQLGVSAKAGLALVSTTADYRVDGVFVQSSTKRQLSPYLGAFVEYDLAGAAKLIGGVDVYRWRISGDLVDGADFVYQLGLGAKVDF